MVSLEEIEPNWFLVKSSGQLDLRLNDFIRYGIKLNYRKYDTIRRSWVIHRAFTTIIIDKISALDLNHPPVQDTSITPHEILFVTPNAPMEVVSAAYKALAKIHHSDIGGSDEKMTEINIAYQTIKSKS